MKAIRHLPLAVFLLMFVAAVAAMGIGWVLARVEREEVVLRDDAPLTDFVAGFGNEVDGLEKNLDRTLMELCRLLEPEMSDRGMIALGETYAGVRQVSLVKSGLLGKGDVLEQSLEVDGTFPVPRVAGRGGIDLGQLKAPGVLYFWAQGVDGSSYFVTRQGREAGRVLILGIDREEIISTMAEWLGAWAGKAGETLIEGEWRHRLIAPSGVGLVDFEAGEGRPDTIYPIGSRMGSWQLQSWDQRETVVEYREPVLITAAALAVGLLAVGVMVFFLLRRSVAVAMQRVSFVNQVSHELRTPLTNMMLNLDLAKDAVGSEGMAARRLGLMGEELGRLQRLLENILTFSSRGKAQLARPGEELDLEGEVRGALGPMEPAMKRRGICPEVKVEEGLLVLGDRDALAQVLGNLFSNVLKYGGDESELLVEGFSREGKVVVRVMDSGPGVERRNRERIFKPFYRVSRRVDEGVSGSGLGLAISRDLVGSMGGALFYLEREDDVSGACFELSLPRVESGAEIVPFETKVS